MPAFPAFHLNCSTPPEDVNVVVARHAPCISSASLFAVRTGEAMKLRVPALNRDSPYIRQPCRGAFGNKDQDLLFLLQSFRENTWNAKANRRKLSIHTIRVLLISMSLLRASQCSSLPRPALKRQRTYTPNDTGIATSISGGHAGVILKVVSGPLQKDL